MWRQHVFILTILKSNEPNEAKWFKRWILSAQIVWLEDKHILLRWSLLRGHVKFCGGHIIRILYIHTPIRWVLQSRHCGDRKKLRSCTSLAVLALISASWPSLEKGIFMDFHRWVAFFFLFSQGFCFPFLRGQAMEKGKILYQFWSSMMPMIFRGTQAESDSLQVFKERPLRFPRRSRVHRSCDEKSLLIWCIHTSLHSF